MVITVEPGLYFGAWRDDIEIDSKWAGIGVRIEDNVLITVTIIDMKIATKNTRSFKKLTYLV